MTLPTSGTLSLDAINSEFNLGRNLAVYRGVKWYKDDNSRGFFDNSSTGNFPPIDFAEFYGKRKTITVTPSDTTYYSSTTITVPFYNTIQVTVVAGTSGGGGDAGFSYNWVTGQWQAAGGSSGSPGGASSFVSSSVTYFYAGSDGSSSGTINAETTSNAPLKDVVITITVGAQGIGGAGGGQDPYKGAKGSDGSAGYVRVIIG
jgi:hypothetical protein